MARKHERKRPASNRSHRETLSQYRNRPQCTRFLGPALVGSDPEKIAAKLPQDCPRKWRKIIAETIAHLEALAEANVPVPAIEIRYPSKHGGFSTVAYLPGHLAEALGIVSEEEQA